jgi:arylsulfatase A-like enzyme
MNRWLSRGAGVFGVFLFVSGVQAASPPNVVIILADDLGFSDIGCYGGEIATPNLDRLAQGGLRFTQMYNTARCWPSRACLLTGYYAQQVNRDPPGPRPAWAALLPALLKSAGYRSYHSGKWHVDGQALPQGFDRSYRFEDYDRYFTPKKHYLDDQLLPPVKPKDHFYATTAMAQHAIDFLGEHAGKHADQPFFLYLAFIAPHFPLHALPEDIARYRDRYLEGWEVIRQQRWQRLREAGIVDCGLAALDPKFTPRYFKPEVLKTLGPGEIEHAFAWKELTPTQQRFQATKMAIHAAMVDREDREIGRVFEQLHKMGVWDNTVIIFVSDNGADATIMVRGDGHDQAAAPGSAASFLCLGPGWASSSNAPFRRHKIWVYEGGISTPCIIHWPARIHSGGALRHTQAHFIDLVPTVLDLAGVTAPAKWNGQARPPFPGKSLVPTLDQDVAIPRDYLYWHHEGNRALRVGDWKLVSESENASAWELYDLKTDRIESKDLAAQQPDRVEDMAAKWKRLDDEFRRQSGATAATKPARVARLFDWERGIGVESPEQPGMAVYLWVYEWNMFEAVNASRYTHNEFARFTHSAAADGRTAEVRAEDIILKATAVRDGADLELTVTNRSDHDWPEMAAIVPCFNPGPPATRNPQFINKNTYFPTANGLAKQDLREIHYNADLRDRIDALSDHGQFVWSRKWPTSPVNATGGLIIRESNDGRWVAGISWDRFLSVQGHNPWDCMHLSVRVGPLKRGESRTVHGRIYLFRGDRAECLKRFRAAAK